MSQPRQRIVVIGAGVGGLTAAALLAQRGHDVTVLEAHVDPGGCAATFSHQGYRFDAGATLVGGFQPGGAHAIVGDTLGIDWPVRRADPAMQVHLPDALVTRWGDPDCWGEERRRVFPDTEGFWRAQERLADRLWTFAASAPPWPPQSPADVVGLASRLRLPLVSLAPGLLGTVATWADRLGSRQRAFRTFVDAQLLIAAQADASRVNPLYGAVALDLPRQGVYHVQGGVGGIATTLVAALERHGGRILYKRRATRIERRAGRAVAVHVEAGPRHRPRAEDYPADVVLANLTPWNLAALLGEDHRPPTTDHGKPSSANSVCTHHAPRTTLHAPRSPLHVSRTTHHAPRTTHHATPLAPDTPMWGACMVYVGLDAAAVPPGLPDHHQIVMDYDKPLGEGNSVFLSLSPAWDTSRAPVGQRALTLSTHTHIRPWWDLNARDHDAYLAAREAMTDRLLDAAERVLPGLRRHARLILPATPVTFEFYTRRALGMVGGFPQTSLFRARGPRTATPNVFLVGDSIFPGQSTAGVTLGALRVANSIGQD